MPAARSGLRSPQSDASYASRSIAANLRLIVDGAYGGCSSAIRYGVTTVLLNARRDSEHCQSMIHEWHGRTSALNSPTGGCSGRQTTIVRDPVVEASSSGLVCVCFSQLGAAYKASAYTVIV